MSPDLQRWIQSHLIELVTDWSWYVNPNQMNTEQKDGKSTKSHQDDKQSNGTLIWRNQQTWTYNYVKITYSM